MSQKFLDRKNSLNKKKMSDTLHADDLVDPRIFFSRESRKKDVRKLRQLCGQVARQLNGIFGGECGEDLSQVYVESVDPAPDSSRLMVHLSWVGAPEEVDPNEILLRIKNKKGYLRQELAIALNRRRVPELLFGLGPVGGQQ